MIAVIAVAEAAMSVATSPIVGLRRAESLEFPSREPPNLRTVVSLIVLRLSLAVGWAQGRGGTRGPSRVPPPSARAVSARLM